MNLLNKPIWNVLTKSVKIFHCTTTICKNCSSYLQTFCLFIHDLIIHPIWSEYPSNVLLQLNPAYYSDEVARISTAAQLGVRGKFLWGRICYQIKLALEIQRRLKQNIFSSSFSLKNHLFLIPPIKFFYPSPIF